MKSWSELPNCRLSYPIGFCTSKKVNKDCHRVVEKMEGSIVQSSSGQRMSDRCRDRL